MWIIPKNLHTCHFALDTEALTLDLSELSTMCEQSLMWRSKPSNVQTWSQRWKRVGWMQHLFGRISKPSHGEAFVERWTSSAVASLVNPSQVQVKEQETKIPATYGHTSSEESKLSDLPLFSWRTWKASSVQSSKVINGMTQRERQFCFMSSENWKDWVINQRRVYSQRLKLAYPITGKGYLYWATPRANLIAEENINTFLKRYRKGNVHSMTLMLQVNHPFLVLGRKSKTSLSHHEPSMKRLNPRWVDCLMGLPIGWTCPSSMKLARVGQTNLEVLEMEWSHKPPPKLSIHS